MDLATLAAWHNFFAAQLGAAASLTGLLFVAISLNIARILQFRGLPEQAGATVLVLLSAVVQASCSLAPQPPVALGFELLAAGAAVWVLAMIVVLGPLGAAQPALQRWLNAAFFQAATVPTIVAGAALLAGAQWWPAILAIGLVVSLIVAVSKAWVLMVEILR